MAEKLREAKYKITYRYTTGSISGTVGGDPEFFSYEQPAIERYLHLKEFGLTQDDIEWERRDLDRSSVMFWKISGYTRVLPAPGD